MVIFFPYKISTLFLSYHSSPWWDSTSRPIALQAETIPQDHASRANIFAFQMRFLLEVSEARESNKMDARSLAIVFTPCLFSVEEDDFATKSSDKTKSLDLKLDVVQTLITNAHKVRPLVIFSFKNIRKFSTLVCWVFISLFTLRLHTNLKLPILTVVSFLA
jgi:hypothetical protein